MLTKKPFGDAFADEIIYSFMLTIWAVTSVCLVDMLTAAAFCSRTSWVMSVAPV